MLSVGPNINVCRQALALLFVVCEYQEDGFNLVDESALLIAGQRESYPYQVMSYPYQVMSYPYQVMSHTLTRYCHTLTRYRVIPLPGNGTKAYRSASHTLTRYRNGTKAYRAVTHTCTWARKHAATH